MRAAPACLTMIAFLLSSAVFSQENVSKIKNKPSTETQKTTSNYEKVYPEKKLISYTKAKILDTRSKNNNLPRKTILKTSDTIHSIVPRTTVDFY